MNNKYCEYFNVDEKYFPCIDDSAIEAGAMWENTYPHDTFINMLEQMEKALARQNSNKTLWIEGAYGTGKSQCVYALRKIFEVPEEKLNEYWNSYDILKTKNDLLQKIIGHKKSGLIVAHRYASGDIMSAKNLFFAIQESIKNSLKENSCNLGENSLKDSIIAWLDDTDHKVMFDSLLNNPAKEWKALFSQSSADSVLHDLKQKKEIKSLVDNIFRLADKEGIVALTIDADRLIAWITEVIESNNVKIIFIWDEFSDYFQNNRESLSEFQKIVALVQNKPFYFIPVTHNSSQTYFSENEKSNQNKIGDRFVKISIEMPDNIAFNLIGHAFNVKASAKEDWTIIADDLNSRIHNSRSKVMTEAKISNSQVIKDIMPLHPMTALLLKNIASAFKSNQRSMFDFIKSSKDDDIKAFQWFCTNHGPLDYYPLLTVDMLWNFFYEKGRDNLSSDIRLILDTFQQHPNLREDEKSVLKAILIMQSIDQRTGGVIELFKATDQTLSYVFEGISDLEGTKSGNLAKGMKEKGILVTTPLSNNRTAYTTAVLAGDQAKIDTHKKELRENSKTNKLAVEGNLANVLLLNPALKLRFETEPNTGKLNIVTKDDFTRIINNIRDKESKIWKFNAVIAFAKDDVEASDFRVTLKNAVANEEYKDIIFIDALSSPLGSEKYEQYIEHSAMARYYQGNNRTQSEKSANNARMILEQDWKNTIYNGQFIVYNYNNQEGEKLSNAQGVNSVLQTIVANKFPLIFDFVNRLTESQLKLTSAKQSALGAITKKTSGAMNGIEKYVLPTVWDIENYWKDVNFCNLNISKIKNEVESLIDKNFTRDGQISIGEIYDFLENDYGFAPSNLAAFITGFLLKEYSNSSFRYGDSQGGHEPMSRDKLAEMIGNYIGKNAKQTYIIKMTPEEMAFYDLNEKIWNIPQNSCSSISQASSLISIKMRNFKLPTWCLKEVDQLGVYDILEKYNIMVISENREQHKIAIQIGKIFAERPMIAEQLSSLLTADSYRIGMISFLKSFDDGNIIKLAEEIGAKSNIIADIASLFEVKHSCLWDKKIGEDEIRKQAIVYSTINVSNDILNVTNSTLSATYHSWRETLKFLGLPYEALKAKYPQLGKVLDVLRKIYNQEDIILEQLKSFNTEIIENKISIIDILANTNNLFIEIFNPYLEELTNDDIKDVKSQLPIGFFALSQTECNSKVKIIAEDFCKSLLKLQLSKIWQEKTDTKNPREWSQLYKTPILSCVNENEFAKAKHVFEILNRNNGTDNEIKIALEYLSSTTLFDVINNENEREKAFVRDIIGPYINLVNIAKVKNVLCNLSLDVYDWRENPTVKSKIEQLAKAEYNAGGSDKVFIKIDKMDNAKLKEYLKNLIKGNMTVGMEILNNQED